MSEEAASEEAKKDDPEAGGTEVATGSDLPPKVDLKLRLQAAGMDIALAMVCVLGGTVLGIVANIIGLSILTPILGCLGSVAGGGYLLVRDSLNDGRSVGKQQMGLTVATPSGNACTQSQSIQRNAFLGAPMIIMAVLQLGAGVLTAIPLIGWIFGIFTGGLIFLVGLGCSLPALYELAMVVQMDPDGRRMMERNTACYTALQ